jgi:hypothetical protein
LGDELGWQKIVEIRGLKTRSHTGENRALTQPFAPPKRAGCWLKFSGALMPRWV